MGLVTMSMSPRAFEGRIAAVKRNPYGAKYLLNILREHPEWVKYKDDEYGPLAVVLFWITQSVSSIGATKHPLAPLFPKNMLEACRQLAQEWRSKEFTKSELADLIESIIGEIS